MTAATGRGGPDLWIPVELYDALVFSPMPDTESMIAWALIRRLYRADDSASVIVTLDSLEEQTGRDRAGLSRALDNLILNGVVVQLGTPDTGGGRRLWLNEDHEQWGDYSVSWATMREG